MRLYPDYCNKADMQPLIAPLWNGPFTGKRVLKRLPQIRVWRLEPRKTSALTRDPWQQRHSEERASVICVISFSSLS